MARVFWVQLLAQCRARGTGREVGCTAVAPEAAQAETAGSRGKGGLFPLPVIWAKVREGFEARANSGVKLNQRISVVTAWDDANRVDHFAERSALPEEKERDLRIRKFSQGGEETAHFLNPFRRVLRAEIWVAYWTSQQFKALVEVGGDVVREKGHVTS